jgi:hypothetical protein
LRATEAIGAAFGERTRQMLQVVCVRDVTVPIHDDDDIFRRVPQSTGTITEMLGMVALYGRSDRRQKRWHADNADGK